MSTTFTESLHHYDKPQTDFSRPATLLLTIVFWACSNSIIINTQSLARPPCAKETDPLTIRIFNDSQFDISNLSMETTGCWANFAGLEQGETTCPLPVEPFKANFDFMIYITRANMWSNEFTRKDTGDCGRPTHCRRRLPDLIQRRWQGAQTTSGLL